MPHEFTIPGEPKEWMRAIPGRMGPVTPKPMREYQARVAMLIRASLAKDKVFRIEHPRETPWRLEADFVSARPKTGPLSAAKRLSLWFWNVVTPDLSNLLKNIEDGIVKSGRVIHDDCQIVQVVVQKRYVTGDERPHTRIRLSALATESTDAVMPAHSETEGMFDWTSRPTT